MDPKPVTVTVWKNTPDGSKRYRGILRGFNQRGVGANAQEVIEFHSMIGGVSSRLFHQMALSDLTQVSFS